MTDAEYEDYDATQWTSWVSRMPVDHDLLAPLGEVHWAAARLHSQVRDAINDLKQEQSDAPFDDTLGGSITELFRLADGKDDQRSRALSRWVRATGRPASQARNYIAHAVVYAEDDGAEAMMDLARNGSRDRITFELLGRVSGQLVHAAVALGSVRGR